MRREVECIHCHRSFVSDIDVCDDCIESNKFTPNDFIVYIPQRSHAADVAAIANAKLAEFMKEKDAEIGELKALVQYAEQKGYATREIEHANDRRLLSANTIELTRLRDSLKIATEALDRILEYWNRHQGEEAMLDALEFIMSKSASTLRMIKEVRG